MVVTLGQASNERACFDGRHNEAAVRVKDRRLVSSEASEVPLPAMFHSSRCLPWQRARDLATAAAYASFEHSERKKTSQAFALFLL